MEKATSNNHGLLPAGRGDRCYSGAVEGPAAGGVAANPARPDPTRPERPFARGLPHASPALPRGPGRAAGLRSKMEVAATAGGRLRNARPPHGRAGPKLGRAPGEARGPGSEEAARRPPLTHRPVAQDRDLPGLGLRHLGGLLSPGSTTSTAAAAAPALRSAAAAPGHSGIQGRGGAGGRGCLSSSLARPTARNRRAAPPPNTPT